jgi:KRAB domain-containing zinc finger protein
MKTHLKTFHLTDEDGYDDFNNDVVEKAIKCSQCNMKVDSDVHLDIHLKTFHSPPNGFNCPKCPNAFKTKSFLKLHINSCHPTVKKKCEKCLKEFENEFQLKKHVRNCRLTYTCKTCSKKFRSRQLLEKHTCKPAKTTDVGLKCEFFSKRFPTELEIKTHIEEAHIGATPKRPKQRNRSK